MTRFHAHPKASGYGLIPHRLADDVRSVTQNATVFLSLTYREPPVRQLPTQCCSVTSVIKFHRAEPDDLRAPHAGAWAARLGRHRGGPARLCCQLPGTGTGLLPAGVQSVRTQQLGGPLQSQPAGTGSSIGAQHDTLRKPRRATCTPAAFRHIPEPYRPSKMRIRHRPALHSALKRLAAPHTRPRLTRHLLRETLKVLPGLRPPTLLQPRAVLLVRHLS